MTYYVQEIRDRDNKVIRVLISKRTYEKARHVRNCKVYEVEDGLFFAELADVAVNGGR